MLALFHIAIDRGDHEKYLFLEILKIHSWQRVPQDRLHSLNDKNNNNKIKKLISHSEKAKGRDYASFSVLSKILQKVLSKRIAC